HTHPYSFTPTTHSPQPWPQFTNDLDILLPPLSFSLYPSLSFILFLSFNIFSSPLPSLFLLFSLSLSPSLSPFLSLPLPRPLSLSPSLPLSPSLFLSLYLPLPLPPSLPVFSQESVCFMEQAVCAARALGRVVSSFSSNSERQAATQALTNTHFPPKSTPDAAGEHMK